MTDIHFTLLSKCVVRNYSNTRQVRHAKKHTHECVSSHPQNGTAVISAHSMSWDCITLLRTRMPDWLGLESLLPRCSVSHMVATAEEPQFALCQTWEDRFHFCYNVLFSYTRHLLPWRFGTEEPPSTWVPRILRVPVEGLPTMVSSRCPRQSQLTSKYSV